MTPKPLVKLTPKDKITASHGNARNLGASHAVRTLKQLIIVSSLFIKITAHLNVSPQTSYFKK